MNIITLTKPNGDVVNLPPAAISEFETAGSGYAKGVNTVLITTNGHKHSVPETVDQIKAMLSALPGA
ncbi:hypothetical protein [Bradyrhizobium sp.]|jgi:hypothetical protein|uniref:hypothetical protein n=1 Tax=Bradyrhizobium sp. TaxID=376 RepID=UPI002C8C089D|nr:hypothetical protein [Bradyrhizobium sp.]HWX60613.1 hypothetical protein [Bradyrhizobium sp.]